MDLFCNSLRVKLCVTRDCNNPDTTQNTFMEPHYGELMHSESAGRLAVAHNIDQLDWGFTIVCELF